MNHHLENNKLTVRLPERITNTNATEIRDEIIALLEKSKPEKLELNCRELKYLSSIGLRALLFVRRKLSRDKEVHLTDVNDTVYDIIDMTGLDDIFLVSKCLKKISIQGLKPIAYSVSGELYQLKNGMMVKVFDPHVPRDAVEQEMRYEKKAFINGVPTAISFSMVQIGEDRYGIVVENIHGVQLSECIRNNPDKLEQYAVMFADFVKELHNIRIHPDDLPDIKKRYLFFIDNILDIVDREALGRLSYFVKAVSDTDTFVHGNINMNNVFVSGDDLIVMDLDGCGYGHPVFDLQEIYASLVAMEIDDPGFCEKHYGIAGKDCVKIWKAFIHRYLGDENNEMRDMVTFGDGDSKAILVRESKMNQMLIQCHIFKTIMEKRQVS